MIAPLPSLPEAFSRRSAILCLAALPLAGLPALAAPVTPDPILDLYRRALEARAYACERGITEEECEDRTAQMIELEEEGMETAPTTIEGAIAGLEWARYEHIEVGGCDGGIVLAMIDGALKVLRRLAHV